jgi:hypothetical protein
VEIWLSILVRQPLKRGSCSSMDELVQQVPSFIAYYNKQARPFAWPYRGRMLST